MKKGPKHPLYAGKFSGISRVAPIFAVNFMYNSKKCEAYFENLGQYISGLGCRDNRITGNGR